jgi:hypothetical protein
MDKEKNMAQFPNLDFLHMSLVASVIEITSNREIMEIVCSFKLSSYRSQFFHLSRFHPPCTLFGKF